MAKGDFVLKSKNLLFVDELSLTLDKLTIQNLWFAVTKFHVIGELGLAYFSRLYPPIVSLDASCDLHCFSYAPVPHSL